MFFKPFIAILQIIFYFAATAASAVDSSADSPSGANASARHNIPFLTVRNKTGDDLAVDFFGGERDILRAGYCEVSRTQVPALKSIAENVPFYVPEDILQLDAIQEIPVENLWAELEKSSNGRLPVLYTHGYNVSFDRSCRRASDFKRSLDLTGRFVLFSWPSDGVMVNYTDDEADLYWSVDPLQKMLRTMVRHFGAGKTNIVAHSLGTRGVMLALVRMIKAEGVEMRADEPLINHVVLIAPDIDAGIFKQYLPYIKSLAKDITIYVSAHDSPLAISSQVHGYPRLGEPGPHLDRLDGIEIIEVSDVPVQYPSGHLYHLYNDRVIADIHQLLNENETASQRSDLKQTGKNYWRLPPALVDIPLDTDESVDGR